MSSPARFLPFSPGVTATGLAALLLAAPLVGCGDSEDAGGPSEPEPTPAALGDLPPGTFQMTIAEGDTPPALAFLEGGWTMRVEEDGDALVTHQSGQTVIGRITVTGDELTIRDLGGELACLSPQDQGTYKWSESGTTLDLDVVSDGCDGRRFVLLYAPWTRR